MNKYEKCNHCKTFPHDSPASEIENKPAGTWQTLEGCHGNKL